MDKSGSLSPGPLFITMYSQVKSSGREIYSWAAGVGVGEGQGLGRSSLCSMAEIASTVRFIDPCGMSEKQKGKAFFGVLVSDHHLVPR